jgi:uncharacterized membrane protein
MNDAVPVFTTPSPRIRRVSVDRPWTWLAAGWRDMIETPRITLVFGLGIAGISLLITLSVITAGVVYLLLPLTAGFFFVAPIIAIGLFEVSRRNEAGLQTTLPQVVFAFRRNGGQIALMGLMLMLLHLAWVRIATLLFALFFQNINPPLDALIDALFFSPVSLPFLITGTLLGAVLAVIAFSISAVAMPMLLDRDANVFTAVATSCVAVRANWPAMALWAALIVAFTSLGLVTFYLGLIVAMPLIAYASWHAYKDIVE